MQSDNNQEKICLNCKHLLWMIGIGQGLKCGHPERSTKTGMPRNIPRRDFSCKLFDRKKEIKDS